MQSTFFIRVPAGQYEFQQTERTGPGWEAPRIVTQIRHPEYAPRWRIVYRTSTDRGWYLRDPQSGRLGTTQSATCVVFED